MDFEIGQIAGDYEILQLLGAGGMGKVYKVRNTISDRIEAMKVLQTRLDEHPELVDRFGREIKVTASLDHPNIAALRTAQRIGNQMVMVVEYVEGSSLDSLMRQGRLGLPQAIDAAHQALAALAYAHSRGVVHRDIKPGNIMLTADGRVKLMDFGIARMTADRTLTKTGQMVGSLYYMSPEQVEGKSLDARSDLYSLGVTLYEMATGKKPFEGDSDYAILAGHLHQTPPPPVELDPSLPASLNEVILMAMAKEPEARFQTAVAFGNALASVASEMGVGLTPAGEGTGSGSSHRAMVDTVALPSKAPAVATPPPAASMAPPASAPPTPSANAAPVGASAMPSPSRGSNRALWMVAGALASLAVLAAAVIYVPRMRRTQAEPAAATQTAPAAAETPAQPGNGGADSTAAPAVPTPAASQNSAPAETAQQPAAKAEPNTAGLRANRAVGAARAVREQAAPAQQAAQGASAQAGPPTPPPPAPTTPTATASPAAVSQAELDKLRDDLNMLATRVGAVSSSLDGLQRAQASQGYTLRGDIVASRRRMELLMDQTEANINQGRADAARKSMDAAEAEVEKLEKFLGR